MWKYMGCVAFVVCVDDIIGGVVPDRKALGIEGARALAVLLPHYTNITELNLQSLYCVDFIYSPELYRVNDLDGNSVGVLMEPLSMCTSMTHFIIGYLHENVVGVMRDCNKVLKQQTISEIKVRLSLQIL